MADLTQRQRWIVAGVTLSVFWLISRFTGGPHQIYKTAQWSDQASLPISRALAQSNIRDCGQYQSLSMGNGQYAVRCSMDGVTWKNYTVDVSKDRAY